MVRIHVAELHAAGDDDKIDRHTTSAFGLIVVEGELKLLEVCYWGDVCEPFESN